MWNWVALISGGGEGRRLRPHTRRVAKRHGTRPALEVLEARDVPSTFAASSTTLALATSGNDETLTATVAEAATGAATPTGEVVFLDAGVVVGSATLAVSGSGLDQASVTLPNAAVGPHVFSVIYEGDGNYAGSVSLAATQGVGTGSQAATVSLTESASPDGNTATPVLTVQVSDPQGSTAGGTVTFLDGTQPLGTMGLDSSGTMTVQAVLNPGDHSLEAIYSGPTGNSGASPVVDYTNPPPMQPADAPPQTVVPGAFPAGTGTQANPLQFDSTAAYITWASSDYAVGRVVTNAKPPNSNT